MKIQKHTLELLKEYNSSIQLLNNQLELKKKAYQDLIKVTLESGKKPLDKQYNLDLEKGVIEENDSKGKGYISKDS